MSNETLRIGFIEKRDGIPGAVDFCHRTLAIYRKALLSGRKQGFSKPHHATLPEYRRDFIESVIAFRRYVAANRHVC